MSALQLNLQFDVWRQHGKDIHQTCFSNNTKIPSFKRTGDQDELLLVEQVSDTMK